MKKFLSLVLALVLCLSVASIAMPASAEEAPYELVWLRYGSVGTTDTQPGLGAVQDAVNEWLKNNGYNFTVDMMHVEDMNNLQVQMAAKEKLDIIWRNASTLSDTLIRGNFLYNIVDLYKNYEGLYNSIPENIWNTLLRENGKALYMIPTYKECGIGVSVSVPVSACKKFGWDELLNDDHTKIWSLDEFTPYLEQAAEDGSYEVLYNFDNNEVVNGSREYYMLDKIAAMGVGVGYVTLHVGLGTFRPVKEEEITDHEMHSEYCVIPQETADLINRTKAAGGRCICVGTTSCRTLESWVAEDGHMEAKAGWTNIYIYPGYKFKVMDGLVTNFHLPESTLIMLVSAFAGREHVLAAYQEAVKERYRFFSFGDAMFLS